MKKIFVKNESKHILEPRFSKILVLVNLGFKNTDLGLINNWMY